MNSAFQSWFADEPALLKPLLYRRTQNDDTSFAFLGIEQHLIGPRFYFYDAPGKGLFRFDQVLADTRVIGVADFVETANWNQMTLTHVPTYASLETTTLRHRKTSGSPLLLRDMPEFAGVYSSVADFLDHADWTRMSLVAPKPLESPSTAESNHLESIQPPMLPMTDDGGPLRIAAKTHVRKRTMWDMYRPAGTWGFAPRYIDDSDGKKVCDRSEHSVLPAPWAWFSSQNAPSQEAVSKLQHFWYTPPLTPVMFRCSELSGAMDEMTVYLLKADIFWRMRTWANHCGNSEARTGVSVISSTMRTGTSWTCWKMKRIRSTLSVGRRSV
ncbi:hypothetical protein C8R47DRAFT_320158 [Mycena vitilis]|nr:hypothetical protein C8R47DRAFT_320158 [Mycena vitilis]